MYTVSKGPSKFVAKRRIGKPSHLDNSWDISKKGPETSFHEDTNVVTDISKPVFVQLNNRKLHNMRFREAVTPEHEEIIKFVSENWSSVSACKSKDSLSIKNGGSPIYYEVNEGNNQLKDFVPFDLDSWWGKRIFNTITKSVP